MLRGVENRTIFVKINVNTLFDLLSIAITNEFLAEGSIWKFIRLVSWRLRNTSIFGFFLRILVHLIVNKHSLILINLQILRILTLVLRIRSRIKGQIYESFHSFKKIIIIYINYLWWQPVYFDIRNISIHLLLFFLVYGPLKIFKRLLF